jgi:eukaryotic-like serine/threonine-protein kinase
VARDRYDDEPLDDRDYEHERVTEVRHRAGPPPRPPWWRERWWIWGLVLLLLVAALIAFFFLRDEAAEEAADDSAVPELIGLQEDEAVQRVEAAGLEADVQRALSEETIGTVIDQSPDPGTELEDGGRVLIVVAAGEDLETTETETDETETETVIETETVVPENVEVPDVVGQDHEEAGATIDDAGLIANTYPTPSDEPRGTVLAQSPDSGAEVVENSAVRLNVSLGPGGLGSFQVPDLTGLDVREALEECRRRFTCRAVERGAPSEEEVGEVLDQRPAAGTSAEQLSQITLFVGR